MGLEVVAHIVDLVPTNPVGAVDPKSQGDDHIRNIKLALKTDLHNITGVVDASHDELNLLVGITGTIWSSSNDGSGSGLDSDLLDGQQGSYYQNSTNQNAGTLADARLSSNVPLKNTANTFTTAQTVADNAANPALSITTSNAGQSPRLVLTSSAGSWLVYMNAASSALSFFDGTADRLVISNGGAFNFKAGTVTTDNASASEVGFKGAPRDSQNAGYTLVLTDAGGFVYMQTNGTFTIPAHGSVDFPLGTVITFANLSGGDCTIAIDGSDVLCLAGTTSTGSRTLADKGIATALKTDADRWLISGAGLS